MSENPASKVQEKNPEKETSIPEETISNSESTELEENSMSELKAVSYTHLTLPTTPYV